MLKKTLCNLTLCTTLLSFNLSADTNANTPPFPTDADTLNSPIATETSQAAIEWLTLLDQIKYGISWTEAGAMLKDSVTRDQWAAAMDKLRRPLGYNKARTQRSIVHKNVLPGGSTGNFIVIKYNSAFLGQSAAEETLILSRERDNFWKVIHYDVH